MDQTQTPQQQLRYLNNEQQLWLREARKHERDAKRFSKAGFIVQAEEAQARSRHAAEWAKQMSPSIRNLRRELRQMRKQLLNEPLLRQQSQATPQLSQ